VIGAASVWYSLPYWSPRFPSLPFSVYQAGYWHLPLRARNPNGWREPPLLNAFRLSFVRFLCRTTPSSLKTSFGSLSILPCHPEGRPLASPLLYAFSFDFHLRCTLSLLQDDREDKRIMSSDNRCPPLSSIFLYVVSFFLFGVFLSLNRACRSSISSWERTIACSPPNFYALIRNVSRCSFLSRKTPREIPITRQSPSPQFNLSPYCSSFDDLCQSEDLI